MTSLRVRCRSPTGTQPELRTTMLRPFCRNLSPAGCILQIVDQSIRYKSNLINQPPTRILEKRQRRTCAAEVPETGGFSTCLPSPSGYARASFKHPAQQSTYKSLQFKLAAWLGVGSVIIGLSHTAAQGLFKHVRETSSGFKKQPMRESACLSRNDSSWPTTTQKHELHADAS